MDQQNDSLGQAPAKARADYAERVAARRERLEEAAARAMQASNTVYRQAKDMAGCIPFGQPILVDHYSAGRDRRFRARIHDKFGKAFALADRAIELAARAASVGTGGISGDDPEAIAKLREQIESAKASQERMKQVNKVIRVHKTQEGRVSALVALGISEPDAAELLAPDFAGRIGFPSYALANNNANIRRMEGRIAELEALAKRVSAEREGNGYTYREDAVENRVMFLFEGKPADAVRAILKANGFKWSPTRSAWVRQMTGNALGAARIVRAKLDAGVEGQ